MSGIAAAARRAGFPGGAAVVLAAAVIAALLAAFDGPGWASSYPREWVIDITGDLTAFLRYVSRELDFGLFTFSQLTRGIGWCVEQPMLLIQGVLADGFRFELADRRLLHVPPLPWVSVALLLTFVAWRIGGTRVAVLTGATLVYFAVFGLWTQAMFTLASVAVAVTLGVAIGLLLGVLGHRSRLARAVLMPLYDLMQTMPVFSYLVPILLFFGFGPVAALIATVIWAMPPMARVATLALARVPANIGEFADIAGCTRRQKTWLVMLPSARQHLLIGVNQVIMFSLAMVIIASIIGAGGLGADVLRALKALRIGDAVEAGVAITLMAIVLDRVSHAAAVRRPMNRDAPRPWYRDRRGTLAVLGLAVGCAVLSPLAPALHVYPASHAISTGAFWADVIAWINVNLGSDIGSLRDSVFVHLMRPTRDFLLGMPWAGLVLVAAAAGFAVGGLRLAGIVAGLLSAIAISGYWQQAMMSLYLVVVSVVIALAAGIPLGIWAALSDRVERVAIVVVDTLQTMPTFVYLIPVVMIFGIGEFPAMVAIVLYAIAPVIRYTNSGIRNVSRSMLEAAEMSGCTRRQTLTRVQIPIALPDVMLGINQTVMMAFAMLVITALVGTRGLEQEALVAVSRVRPGEGIIAGLGIAFMAIVIDRLITGASERLRERLSPARH